jgi:hypothetical protein
MKATTLNADLINLYVEVLKRPLAQRYDMKALIMDLVPAKRMLYQVYISVNGFDGQQVNETWAELPMSEVRFVRFLQGTLFTDIELAQINQAHVAMNASKEIPDKYRYRAPVQSKAFAFYGRKFGRQPMLDRSEVDNLYSESD